MEEKIGCRTNPFVVVRQKTPLKSGEKKNSKEDLAFTADRFFKRHKCGLIHTHTLAYTHADVGPSYFVSVGALLAVGRDCISIERPKKAMLNRRKEIAVKIQ